MLDLHSSVVRFNRQHWVGVAVLQDWVFLRGYVVNLGQDGSSHDLLFCRKVILIFQYGQPYTHILVFEHGFSSQVVNLVGVTLRVEYGGDRVGILSLVVHAGDFDWTWFMLDLTRKGVVRGKIK